MPSPCSSWALTRSDSEWSLRKSSQQNSDEKCHGGCGVVSGGARSTIRPLRLVDAGAAVGVVVVFAVVVTGRLRASVVRMVSIGARVILVDVPVGVVAVVDLVSGVSLVVVTRVDVDEIWFR
mmetsp:Transcript_116017/g.328793  ORF Transcript_116017/g.328793 Transcript_116017/m.328793 type:complete len:122 (+) Transcript_116017:610-975(+)